MLGSAPQGETTGPAQWLDRTHGDCSFSNSCLKGQLIQFRHLVTVQTHRSTLTNERQEIGRGQQTNCLFILLSEGLFLGVFIQLLGEVW